MRRVHLVVWLMIGATYCWAQQNTEIYKPTKQQWLAQKQAAFEENKGQIRSIDEQPAPQVQYHYHKGNMDIFLLPTGIAYQFNRIHYPDGYEAVRLDPQKEAAEDTLRTQVRQEIYRMDMKLVGANPQALIVAEGKSKDYSNYYSRKALKVHHFQQVTYQNIYPGIDWVIYTTENGLKYDFIVHPGADPRHIQMHFKDQKELQLNMDGSFTWSNEMGTITEQAPISFQEDQTVTTHFQLDGNIIRFELGPYDLNKVLTIDPSLIWGTYYGGIEDEYGDACAVDSRGYVYLGGFTKSVTNIGFGGHQNTYISWDAFLVKFDSNGVRQWGTYYGGQSNDWAYSCAVDATDAVYLAGWTSSQDTLVGGHQIINRGAESAFLVKFDSNGVHQWDTYYGGLDKTRGRACAVDNKGNVYLAGKTRSPDGIAFNGHQSAYVGRFVNRDDAFLVKFNSNGVRQWGTYYGGDREDFGYDCAVDHNGNVYLAGYAVSDTGIAAQGHQTLKGVDEDAFLVKFDSNGVRQWGTYYGDSSNDYGFSCAVDGSGAVYLTGYSGSINNIAFRGHQMTTGSNYDAFLVKFSTDGVRQWGTYYGERGFDIGRHCMIDNNNNVYMLGRTNSRSAIAFGGHQMALGGRTDAFLVKFDSSGLRQWGTYYGGFGNDDGLVGAVDHNGNVYLAGHTKSTHSLLVGGHQVTFGGRIDAFLSKFAGAGCPRLIRPIYQTACDSFYHHGRTLTTSGIYTDTLTNGLGCDSVVVLHLTINNSSRQMDIQRACRYYIWIDGNIYTSSTDSATVTLISSTGCDSIITLDLTIHNNTGTDVQTACESYTWIDGNTYTSSNNTATFILTNTAGCDSVVTLDLTINYTTTGVDVQHSCGPYQWINHNVYRTSNNTATFTLVGGGSNGCDSVVTLDLTVHGSTSGRDVQIACGSYTWIDGNTYTSSNYTATDTLTNSVGCDSIVTLDLTVRQINTSITQRNTILTALTTSASYQWIDCDNNLSIVGATSRNFMPTHNGNYAVMITQHGCTDTSACYHFVNPLRVSNQTTVRSRSGGGSLPSPLRRLTRANMPLDRPAIQLYPNPTTGKFTVDLGRLSQNVTLQLHDLTGRQLQTQFYSQLKQTVETLSQELPQGVYILSVQLEQQQPIFFKIIKQ